jgi:hypothetical protein
LVSEEQQLEETAWAFDGAADAETQKRPARRCTLAALGPAYLLSGTTHRPALH